MFAEHAVNPEAILNMFYNPQLRVKKRKCKKYT